MVISSISTQDLARLLQDEGFRAKPFIDDDGDQGVESSSGRWDWKIYVSTINDGQSSRLGFQTFFPFSDEEEASEFCNDFNKKYNFGTLWFIPLEDGETLLFLDHHSDLTGGVTSDWIKSEFGRWATAVSIVCAGVLERRD